MREGGIKTIGLKDFHHLSWHQDKMGKIMKNHDTKESKGVQIQLEPRRDKIIYYGGNGGKIRTIKKVIQSGKRILTVPGGTKTRQARNKMIYDKYKRTRNSRTKRGLNK